MVIREMDPFDVWRIALADELSDVFKMTVSEATTYIRDTGDDCWREMFDDGMTPKEAAGEEAWAAMTSQ
jgi:hypothetical protein